MRIKKNLTVEQLGRLLPLLVELVNDSMYDINSFEELTPSENDIFNDDADLFNEFFTKNIKK